MKINPNIDPLTGSPRAAPAKPAAPAEQPGTSREVTDSVQFSPSSLNRADSHAPSQGIDNSESALGSALHAAQQIKQDSPDALYDWSSMTPERLKELLG